ncbi:hypothetical protein B7P43_G14881 [Cryptotermes secundus]|uniref:Ig-like domain-containing protein n=1 Tax=Cryptotermes secundus TaxID=105785 RepID=A0A2J7RQY8_9NEOP|nr:hypothetical protein B7P43_G14881 [Cryptotermes secundus]
MLKCVVVCRYPWEMLKCALLCAGVLSLKLLRIVVPPYTYQGEKALLQCQYELENDRLYSVTWYKDHEEFYRYVPKSHPPQHSYPLEGIKVDHHQSDGQQVLLKNVNLKASGKYRCEVSAEAPSFTSVHGEGRMEVVALPKEGPQITGEEGMYQVGDVISLNCTSGKSYPPARLRWYINGRPVVPDYNAVVQQHGLVTSVVGLRFEVRPHHFSSGHMQIRCVATISTDLEQSDPPDRAPLLEDNRETLLLGRQPFVLHQLTVHILNNVSAC